MSLDYITVQPGRIGTIKQDLLTNRFGMPFISLESSMPSTFPCSHHVEIGDMVAGSTDNLRREQASEVVRSLV